MPRILVTMGDPAGIGPEVISVALAAGGFPGDCEIEVVGDRSAGVPGRPDARSARAAMQALDHAAQALRDGTADAVVTGPVCKDAMQAEGFAFPGQTEFFAHVWGVEDFTMLLTGRRLTVGLVTIHEPFARVSELLTEDRIVSCGTLVADFLRCRGIEDPRVAVAGLNPHAGENGAFGTEEIRLIAPAVRRLQSGGGGSFDGPCVPDAVFRQALCGGYDAVLAMYHDQGLIPLKLVDFDDAVNVTLGLPKPRTSPDHGTAFSLAGKGLANPSSMVAAIRLACELVER